MAINDPVLYFTMDTVDTSGVTITDQGSGHTNGTLIGLPSSVTGQVGQALSFNGINQYVTVGSAIAVNDNFTMALWVNSAASSQAAMLFYNGDTSGNGYGIFLSDGSCNPGNKIAVIAGGLACNVLSNATAVLSAGTWTHLTVTRSGGVWALYVNGVATVSGNSATPNMPATKLSLASDNGTIPGAFFNGSIDEARFFTRVLSQAEITALFQYSGPAAGAGTNRQFFFGLD